MAAGSVPPIAEPAVQIAETQAILEMLREHAQLSETRHREILDGVHECQIRLDQLSERLQTLISQGTTDSPQLAQILTQVSETRGQVESLSQVVNQLSVSTPRQEPNANQSPASSVAVVEPAVTEPAAIAEAGRGAPATGRREMRRPYRVLR